MAHVTGHQLDDLCYEIIDWFYVIGQSTFYGLKTEKKNLWYDFNWKFIPEPAVKNLSRIFLLFFI